LTALKKITAIHICGSTCRQELQYGVLKHTNTNIKFPMERVHLYI